MVISAQTVIAIERGLTGSNNHATKGIGDAPNIGAIIEKIITK